MIPGPTQVCAAPITRTPTGIGTEAGGPIRSMIPSGPISTTPSYGSTAPPGHDPAAQRDPAPEAPVDEPLVPSRRPHAGQDDPDDPAQSPGRAGRPRSGRLRHPPMISPSAAGGQPGQSSSVSRPCSIAYRASSTRLCSCSLLSVFWTWFCTVRCESTSRSAICRVGQPLRHQPQHLGLALGQPRARRRRAPVPADSRRYSPSTSPASPGVNTASPRGGRSHRGEQLLARGRLHQVAGRAGLHRVQHVGVLPARREHQHPQRRVGRDAAPGSPRPPTASGSCRSSTHDLGPGRGGPADRLAAVAGGRDHLVARPRRGRGPRRRATSGGRRRPSRRSRHCRLSAGAPGSSISVPSPGRRLDTDIVPPRSRTRPRDRRRHPEPPLRRGLAPAGPADARPVVAHAHRDLGAVSSTSTQARAAAPACAATLSRAAPTAAASSRAARPAQQHRRGRA